MDAEIAVAEKPSQDELIKEIRVLLIRTGIETEAELAERAGMKQAYLSRRMTGEVAFDVDDLDQIARVFSVRTRDLFPAEPAAATPLASVEPRVVTRAGQRRGRRLTASYPAGAGGTTPDHPRGHTIRPARSSVHSPERPPSRPDRHEPDRPVRLTRPAGPRRTAGTPGEDGR